MASKYKAVRTNCGAHTHASKREANRCSYLRALEAAGHIRNLEQQPRFDLFGVKYVADFRYQEKAIPMATAECNWITVVEDVKGFKTAVYRIKKKLMKNIHGIEIRETK